MGNENNNEKVLLAKLGTCVSKGSKLSLDEKNKQNITSF